MKQNQIQTQEPHQTPAHKAWVTRRANEQALREKRSQAAIKAWETRRRNSDQS